MSFGCGLWVYFVGHFDSEGLKLMGGELGPVIQTYLRCEGLISISIKLPSG